MTDKRAKLFWQKCKREIAIQTWDFHERLNLSSHPLDKYKTSRNPNIDMKIVLDNPNFEWNFNILSSNPGITFEDMLSTPQFPWSWSQASCNPNITMEIIEQYKDLNWDRFIVCSNPNLTWDYIITYLDVEACDWIALSKHPNITWEIIKNNLNYPWNWSLVFENPNLNWSYAYELRNLLESNIDDMIWEQDMFEIDAIENINRYISNFSNNPNLTWKIVCENPDIEWNYWDMANHPNIKFEHIIRNKILFMNWVNITINPNITWEIIKSNPKLDWFKEGFVENPNITWEIVEKNPQFDWSLIMRNNFKLDRERIIIEEARKHLAAFRIQTYYRNALVNPNTRIGWNKGMSDFKFMQDHLNNQN